MSGRGAQARLSHLASCCHAKDTAAHVVPELVCAQPLQHKQSRESLPSPPLLTVRRAARAPAAEVISCSICRKTPPVQLHLLLSCGAQLQDLPAGTRHPVLHPRYPHGGSCADSCAACCTSPGAATLCSLSFLSASVAVGACYLSGKMLPTVQRPPVSDSAPGSRGASLSISCLL